MRKLSILILTAAAICLTGCADTESSEPTETAANITSETEQPADLVIPVSEITETADFYPVNVDGVNMEVFAVRDSEGNIRTAFNTCQSCYTSGNGRYEVEDNDLVCQNCGFHFTADDIGTRPNGGCSPWAIGEENQTVNDENIIISYDFLAESKNIFANWK